MNYISTQVWAGSRRPWTEAESSAIRALYPSASREDILRAIPERSWVAIEKKGRQLRIARRARHGRWNDEDKNLLIELFTAGASREEIVQAFPARSISGIELTSRRLGLYRRGTSMPRTTRPTLLTKDLTGRRLSLKLPQKVLAHNAKIGFGLLSKFEKNGKGLSIKSLMRVCDALGLELRAVPKSE